MNRYHQDTVSPAERFVVDRWYDSFDDSGQNVPGIEDERIAGETGERIFNKIPLWKMAKPWYSRPGFQMTGTAAVAALLLLFLYLRPYSPGSPPVVYQALKGETKKILLNDSTRIWLNSGSRLEILPDYAKDKRAVKLEGEAYFEVNHNAAKPFLVYAGELTTNVLGTSFTVQAYKASRFARVTLVTGKVWVKITHPKPGKGRGALLLPNQSLQYDYHSKTMAKTNVTAAASSKAWIDGKLIFDNTPMPEVAEILSRALGLKVKLQRSNLDTCRIYGQFDRNDNPEKVVNMICKLISARYILHGNEVEINGKGCNNK